MGRKPNAVISKHFNRGAKLPDNSNRYEHTCRHCGENFPKGRTDTLSAHVLNKCNAISKEDRIDAQRELGVQGGLGGEGDDFALNSANQSSNTREGLYALADAALIGIGVGETAGHGVDQPTKRLKLTEQYSLDHPPPNLDGPSTPRGKRGPKLGMRSRNSKSRTGVMGGDSSAFATSTHPAESLNGPMQTQAAVAFASSFENGNHFESAYNIPFISQPRMDSGHSAMIDPHLQNMEAADRAIVSPGFLQQAQDGRIEHPHWTAEGYDNSQESPQFYEHAQPQELQPRYDHDFYQSAPPTVSSPVAEFSTESGNGKRVSKQRHRGKFDPDKKEEVRKVREKGACIRCRMLKKQCKEGVPGGPCGPCADIQDARVWTIPCTRDRLDTAFYHFKSGIYSSLAYENNITTLKESLAFGDPQVVIDVSQFPESLVFGSFKTRRVTSMSAVPGHEEDRDVLHTPEGNMATVPSNIPIVAEVLILEHESDDVPSKIYEYMMQAVALKKFIAMEPSGFVRAVLETATTLSHKSDITKMALEMFAMVSILLEEQLAWGMSIRSHSDPPGSGTPISPDSESYRLIELQLKAAAEKKAGDLVEKVAGTVDRLLLLANSKGRYDLFIVGLLLLIVLEKATWDFTKWDRHDKPQHSWPHDSKSPGDFVAQREYVASLISALLRIREVPPPAEIDSIGILCTRRDEESQAFFKHLRLSEHYVMQRFYMEISGAYDQNNSRCFEMSLCAWLLMPERLLPKYKQQPKQETPATAQGE